MNSEDSISAILHSIQLNNNNDNYDNYNNYNIFAFLFFCISFCFFLVLFVYSKEECQPIHV